MLCIPTQILCIPTPFSILFIPTRNSQQSWALFRSSALHDEDLAARNNPTIPVLRNKRGDWTEPYQIFVTSITKNHIERKKRTFKLNISVKIVHFWGAFAHFHGNSHIFVKTYVSSVMIFALFVWRKIQLIKRLVAKNDKYHVWLGTIMRVKCVKNVLFCILLAPPETKTQT